MNRLDARRAFERAIPLSPVPAVLVPEDTLGTLVVAARTVAFDVESSLNPAAIRNLDRASEPFVDMVDLNAAIYGATAAMAEFRHSAEIVRNWLDAGCITLPPGAHIRALVDSLT